MPGPKMELEDWLDDLCVRFIINLPAEDLSSVARICFQVEEAQWFYEDFIRPLDPTLPSMSLRTFCLRIFQHCPLLSTFSVENHMQAFEEFMQYKIRVPVRGAIMLNEAMDHTVLVKGWKKGANWSFPRGKINKDESDLDCAIREVYEETGFDIRAAGLVPSHDDAKYIEINMREQQLRLYVFRDVPMDTHFEPKTRKEISRIEWYKLSDLPAFRKKGSHQQQDASMGTNANKFYMVAPFLVPLKKWVVQQKKRDAARGTHSINLVSQPIQEEGLTEDDIGTVTETVIEPIRATPAIGALEGATRELRRLLKVQPPTQGVQDLHMPSSVSGPVAGSSGSSGLSGLTATATGLGAKLAARPPTDPGQEKGNALLAILQPKQKQSQPQPSTGFMHGPHTPLDLGYNSPPSEPRTPHHHHPVPLAPLSSYGPPPTFPLGPASHQVLTYAGAPYSDRQGQYLAHGVSGPGLSQLTGNATLVHPQPLPPGVKSLVQRGFFPSPGVPDLAGVAVHGHGHGQGQHNIQMTPATGIASVRQSGQENRISPPQLTSHSMSLLSVLKSHGGRTGDMITQGQTVSQALSQTVSGVVAAAAGGHSSQYQASGWSGTSVTNAQVSQAQSSGATTTAGTTATAVRTTLGGQSQVCGSLSYILPAQAQAQPSTDKSQHRNALLDMFKSQTQAPTTKETLPISLVDGAGPSPVMHHAAAATAAPAGRPQPQEPLSNPSSTAEAIRTAAQANGGPIQVHPELSLPFGALKILSRPQGLDRGEAPIPLDNQVRGGSNNGFRQHSGLSSPQQLSPGLSNKLQPGTVPGMVPQTSASQPSSVAAALLAQLRPAASTTTMAGQQPPRNPPSSHPSPRQQEKSPEQKNLLLSLFGRSQSQGNVPSALHVEEKGKGKGKGKDEDMPLHLPLSVSMSLPDHQRQQQAMIMNRANSGTPKFASASASAAAPAESSLSAAASRRGSQTPISPADRNFLLGYLQSVTNSAASY